MAIVIPDRRAVPRELLRVPVRWDDGRRGWTRNVSPDGLYVDVRGTPAIARWCSLDIGFRQARLRFHALAEVLRIEPRVGGTGIALRLRERRFHAVR